MQSKSLFILGCLILIRLFAVPLVTRAQTDVFTAPGVSTYTVPANVTQITVTLWGGGGGGGGNESFALGLTCGGGGGGGGEYANATIDVTPGQVYAILVGTGGNSGGSGNNGGAGNRSQINLNGINNPILLTANGGQGGSAATSAATCLAAGGAGGFGGTGTINGLHTPGERGGDGDFLDGGLGGFGFQGYGKGGTGSDDNMSNAEGGSSGRVEVTTITTTTPPTAANDSYSMAQGSVLYIAAPGVLGNDSIPGGTTLTAAPGNNPANGILALNADGSFFYTPNSGFVGIDTFTYKANAGTGVTSTSATVSITVTPSGTSAPSVKAQLAPAIIRVGDAVNIDVTLENPFLAAGGGIDAVETKCSFAPADIVTGMSATPSTDIFKPDPVIINKMLTGENLLYAVSQSGANPLVKTVGRIFTISVNAQKVGQATLNCTAKGIDGTGKEITLASVGVVVDVQNLIAGTGNIKGVVHYSHRPDGGATVTLLNAAQTVIATATTQADGSFIMTGIAVGTYTIRAESPGYLYAQGTVQVANQQTVTKATVKLVAGDLVTTAPIVIDELDVVQLALNYGQTVPPASLASDLNSDNVVGLADLNALAENLRKTGPILWN